MKTFAEIKAEIQRLLPIIERAAAMHNISEYTALVARSNALYWVLGSQAAGKS